MACRCCAASAKARGAECSEALDPNADTPNIGPLDVNLWCVMAAAGQVTPPSGAGDERVTAEHLARLTQYVTHLEAS